MTVWFITGASRGLGLHLARQAAERGDSVVATARRPEIATEALAAVEAGSRLMVDELDVTDQKQAQQVTDRALTRFGRIDVLVNNAGRGLLGAVEEATDAECRAVFDINVFGLLSVTRTVLPVMRAQRSGHVLNISSVGGFAAGTGWGNYCATKFAVEGLSEAMRAELAPLGVHVTIVEPGVFRTDFLDESSLARTANIIPDYDGTVGNTRAWVNQHNHVQPGDPAKGAAAIMTIVGTDNPPTRFPLGADCIKRVEAKLHEVSREFNQWRELAASTAHEEPVFMKTSR